MALCSIVPSDGQTKVCLQLEKGMECVSIGFCCFFLFFGIVVEPEQEHCFLRSKQGLNGKII